MKLILKRTSLVLSLFLCGTLNITFAQKAKTLIRGQVEGFDFKPNSTITFKTYDFHQILETRAYTGKYTCSLNQKGEFELSFNPLDSCFYMEFYVLSGGDGIVRNTGALFRKQYIFEAGDSVNMRLDIAKKTATFNGRGADKLQCQYQLSSVALLPVEARERLFELRANKKYTQTLEVEDKLYAILQSYQKNILESYYGSITPKVYDRINSDRMAYTKFIYIRSKLIDYSVGSKIKKDALHKYFIDYYNKSTSILSDDKAISESPWYIDYLLVRERFINLFIDEKNAMSKPYFEAIYNNIQQKYTGLVRDRLLITSFLLLSQKDLNSELSLVPAAIASMKDKRNQLFLRDWQKKQTAGTMSYNFSFQDTAFKQHTLNDYKGKIIVMDFWFHGCEGCMEIPPVMKTIMEKYKKRADVVFLSVSVDKGRKGWLTGLKLGIYTCPGQIHLNTNGLGIDHPFIKYYNFNSYPQLFIIGKDGAILSSSPPDPRKDNGEGIINLIEMVL